MNIYSELPPTDLKELAAYQIAVQQAALDGKPLQWIDRHRNIALQEWGPYVISVPPTKWNWELFAYRIDPASKPKVLRQWTIEECPLLAEVRSHSSIGTWQGLIIYKDREKAMCGTRLIGYKELLEQGYEWRLSSSVWQRCGIRTA